MSVCHLLPKVCIVKSGSIFGAPCTLAYSRAVFDFSHISNIKELLSRLNRGYMWLGV